MKYIDTHNETIQQENWRTVKKIVIPFLRDSIYLRSYRIKGTGTRDFQKSLVVLAKIMPIENVNRIAFVN